MFLLRVGLVIYPLLDSVLRHFHEMPAVDNARLSSVVIRVTGSSAWTSPKVPTLVCKDGRAPEPGDQLYAEHCFRFRPRGELEITPVDPAVYAAHEGSAQRGVFAMTVDDDNIQLPSCARAESVALTRGQCALLVATVVYTTVDGDTGAWRAPVKRRFYTFQPSNGPRERFVHADGGSSALSEQLKKMRVGASEQREIWRLITHDGKFGLQVTTFGLMAKLAGPMAGRLNSLLHRQEFEDMCALRSDLSEPEGKNPYLADEHAPSVVLYQRVTPIDDCGSIIPARCSFIAPVLEAELAEVARGSSTTATGVAASRFAALYDAVQQRRIQVGQLSASESISTILDVLSLSPPKLGMMALQCFVPTDSVFRALIDAVRHVLRTPTGGAVHGLPPGLLSLPEALRVPFSAFYTSSGAAADMVAFKAAVSKCIMGTVEGRYRNTLPVSENLCRGLVSSLESLDALAALIAATAPGDVSGIDISVDVDKVVMYVDSPYLGRLGRGPGVAFDTSSAMLTAMFDEFALWGSSNPSSMLVQLHLVDNNVRKNRLAVDKGYDSWRLDLRGHFNLDQDTPGGVGVVIVTKTGDMAAWVLVSHGHCGDPARLA